jgi:3',5'-nucleoside bisphosphate phosphatase
MNCGRPHGNDIHVHSNVSDGRLAPAGIVLLAAQSGVDTLVFTEHSAVTYRAALPHARRLGVSMPFPGIEVSTYLGPRRHHLLLYGMGLLADPLPPVLVRPSNHKNDVLERAIGVLRSDHPQIPAFSDILAGTCAGLEPTPGKRLGSLTTAAIAISASSGISAQQARDTLRRAVMDLESGVPLGTKYVTAADVLLIAGRLGLVTCLAHPLWQCADERGVAEVCDDLARLTERGLWGVATRSYHHRALDEHPALSRHARRLGLAVIGGSDFHGNGKTELGGDPTEPHVLQELTDRASSPRTQAAML